VVDFHSICHVPDTTSAILKLIGYKANLMASLNQALAKLVAMGLNSAKFGKGEVSAD
jgi:hypothetical protein